MKPNYARLCLLTLMCFCFLVWESKSNVPEGLYSLAVLCVMAWSRSCVLQGTSHRICLYLFPLCEIRCSGKDQLTDWKMSKDPDTCNGTVCLYFFETFEGAVLCRWTLFYFDQYFLCAACLNCPQASPRMHELSSTTFQVEKIWLIFFWFLPRRTSL